MQSFASTPTTITITTSSATTTTTPTLSSSSSQLGLIPSSSASICLTFTDEIEQEHYQKLDFPFVIGKDVLCGRGETVKVLNKHYRQKIAHRYPAYATVPSGNGGKRKIARSICHSIHINGGKFLTMSGKALCRTDAEDKVMKALRDCGRRYLQKQQQPAAAARTEFLFQTTTTTTHPPQQRPLSPQRMSTLPQNMSIIATHASSQQPQPSPLPVVSPLRRSARYTTTITNDPDVLEVLAMLSDKDEDEDDDNSSSSVDCWGSSSSNSVSDEDNSVVVREDNHVHDVMNNCNDNINNDNDIFDNNNIMMMTLDPIPVQQDQVVGGICQRAASDATFRQTLAWLATLEC